MEGSSKKLVPRLLLAGASRGAGLSSLILGLLVCFRKSGISVGTANVGPSLVETTHFRRISGRLSNTLDPWILSRDAIQDSLVRLATGAEIILIDGDRGVFDLFPEGAAYPTIADFALIHSFPLVLVVNGAGYGESIRALVKGFTEYRSDAKISGVIVTQLKDEAHARQVQAALSGVRGLRYLGGVLDESSLRSGLSEDRVADNPSLLTRTKLLALGERVKVGVDFSSLRELAGFAAPISGEPLTRVKQVGKCRIAVADDAAFHLTVQDNLDLMRRVGAELVAFSPLADTRLPQGASAVYLPSGYPHYYSGELAANKLMITALREFAVNGGVVYAEGDAIAYCARKLVLSTGENFEMVGLLPGSVVSSIDERTDLEPIACEVQAQRSSIAAPQGITFRGLRSSRWIVRLDEPVLTCFQLKDRGTTPQAPLVDGYCPSPHILISTVQQHWGQIFGNQGQSLVRTFVEAATVS